MIEMWYRRAEINFMAEVAGPELLSFKDSSADERDSILQAVFEKEVSHFGATCVQPLVRRWRAVAGLA